MTPEKLIELAKEAMTHAYAPYSGYHVGGTSPFGTRKRMKVYIEETVFDCPLIYINAGHRGLCAEMTPDVLETVLPETQRVKVAIES